MSSVKLETKKQQENTLSTLNKVSLDASHLNLLKDSVGSIKRSAMRFLSGTALSRITGMLRDMALAFAFGTHASVAALFVAFRLSHMCRRLFGEGALQSAFIPVFEELRQNNTERAFKFFRDLSLFMGIFLTILVIVSMAGLAASLHLFDWSAGNREIITLMIVLMPSLIPICLFGVNSALLQCQKNYFTAGIAPAFFNIIITIGAFILMETEPVKAMPYVAISIVIGCIFQWVSTFPATFKHVRQELPGKLLQSLNCLSVDVKKLVGPLALGLLGVGASQINNAIDALFGRYADPEGPAQLWYGLRLFQLPLALFGIAMSGALLPPLSRAIQAGNKQEYLHFLEFALRRVTAFLLPCSIIFYVMGTHIINLIYGHGDFNVHSTYTTTACLHGYTLGLLPMGFIIVLAPAFYAHKDFRTPAIGAIISLVTNLVLNTFLVFVLNWKAVSVALATSVSSWINAYYLYRALERHSGRILSDDGAQEFVKVVAVNFFSGAITWFCQARFFTSASLFNYFTNSAELPTDLLSQITTLAWPGLIFVASFITFAIILKSEDILGLFRQKKVSSELTESSQETPLL